MIGSQVPRVQCVPKFADGSRGVNAAAFCASVGLTLDPWQQDILNVSLATDEAGLWAASRVALSVPRQSGKTALAEARELYALMSMPPKSLIIHSAHLYPTATEAFRRLRSYFDDYPQLREERYGGPGLKTIHDWTGDQSIEMKNGTRLKFASRSKGQGRGFSSDLLMLDECQELSKETWGDILPTVSARPNAQVWLMGTPPSPRMVNAEVFAKIRDVGIAGNDPRLAYFEFSATKDMDFADPKTWAMAIPPLGGRVSLAAVQDEFNSMDLDQFGRERLGIWDEGVHSALFDMNKWDEQGIAARSVPRNGPIAFAVDMNPDRSQITISVARKPSNGPIHVETVRSESAGRGKQWVIDFFRDRPKAPVIVDGVSPAASLIPELVAARIDVTVTSAGDMRQACGMFFDAFSQGELTHFDEDATLTAAVMAAKKRLSGDGGAFVWDRKSFDSDITSLVAGSLAYWGVLALKKRSGAATFV